jgi:hypothetical protein
VETSRRTKTLTTSRSIGEDLKEREHHQRKSYKFRSSREVNHQDKLFNLQYTTNFSSANIYLHFLASSSSTQFLSKLYVCISKIKHKAEFLSVISFILPSLFLKISIGVFYNHICGW